MKLDKNKTDGHLNDETSTEYWDRRDSSDFLEEAEAVKLDIMRPDIKCLGCGSLRLRRRMIDLPVLDDKIIFRKARVFYCPDCKVSVIPQNTREELISRLAAIGAKLDMGIFSDALSEGLESYQKKWTEKENQRKVISVYFPKKDGSPAKAQISLLVSDRLYPILRSLTSEDVRSLLSLEYYEDLEDEARIKDRSISQYLKREIAKKLQMDNYITSTGADKTSSEIKVKNTRQGDPSRTNVLTLRPAKIEAQHLEGQPEGRYELAAHSDEDEQKIYLVAPKEEFIGKVSYDFETGNLVLIVIKDDIGLEMFDMKLVLNDGSVEFRKAAQVKDGKILLMKGTKHFEEDIVSLVLTIT